MQPLVQITTSQIMKMKYLCTLLAVVTLLQSQPVMALDTTRPEIQQFIEEMHMKHDLDQQRLTGQLGEARIREDIIRAISRPAEKKPWFDYRPIFVNHARISGGAEYWQRHADILQRASEQYGVAPEIIVAIIGVETRYGGHTGRYRVLDALATLAFAYPPRSSFFRGELEQFLLLAREEKIDATELKGSYAGAMGHPQFIASSFRRYAVDFDGDGKRDIWNNTQDVIGSVAHYLAMHGWQNGQPVTVQLEDAPGELDSLLTGNLQPDISLSSLRSVGVEIPAGMKPPDDVIALIRLQNRGGYEYWLGLKNFYVITRYNHSALYAMAVYQLASRIRDSYEALVKGDDY